VQHNVGDGNKVPNVMDAGVDRVAQAGGVVTESICLPSASISRPTTKTHGALPSRLTPPFIISCGKSDQS
jgi:hypothetical protein